MLRRVQVLHQLQPPPPFTLQERNVSCNVAMLEQNKYFDISGHAFMFLIILNSTMLIVNTIIYYQAQPQLQLSLAEIALMCNNTPRHPPWVSREVPAK